MNILSAPQAASCDFLLGLESNNPVRVPLRDSPIVTQDPTTGALVGAGGELLNVIAAGQTRTINVPADQPTIAAAMALIAGWVILGKVTIKVADGTHVPTAGVSLNHPFGENIEIVGNTASPANCIIQPAFPPAFDLFTVSGGHRFGRIAGFRFNLASKAELSANYTAILAIDGNSSVFAENCQASNWYYSYAARSGASMRLNACESSNAGDVGIWAFSGGFMRADNCTATGASDAANSLGFGFQAEFGGVLEATDCTASSCREAGFAALSNGTGRLYNCTATGNTGGTGAGFMSKLGGKIEANGSTAGSNTYRIFVSEDGGIYNGPADAGGNANSANTFAFLDTAGGQARVSSSVGALRLDAEGAGTSVFFNNSDGLMGEVRGSSGTATSRAYLQGGSAATADQPIVGVDGAAVNIAMRHQTKGTGSHYFRTGAGTQAEVFNSAGAVDWLGFTGGAGAARIQALGASTNVDVQLDPKGGGLVRFGSFAGTGDVACNGYITIKDAAGNTRKLMTTA